MTEAIAEASKTAEDNVDAVEEKIRIALEEQAQAAAAQELSDEEKAA